MNTYKPINENVAQLDLDEKSGRAAPRCLMTVEETAKALGMKPSAVRRIEFRSLCKLRIALEKIGIRSMKDVFFEIG